jgi:rod shape-determining protein MreC
VIVAVILIAITFVLIGFKVGQAPGPGQATMRAGDDVSAAAGQAATGPARASGDLFAQIGNMWNAAGRVRQLEHQVRDLEAWRDLADRLSERNARYEALLRMPPDSFGEGVNPESSIAAQLVLDSGGPFTRTLVANAGSDHGVHVGYVVLNENGLVGRVVSVGRRSSRVLMLDDYTSRIPVMGEASRVRAVLAGQATSPPELYTAPFQLEAPRLDFVVGAQSLRDGERLITSGDGGLYPRGVTVGVARRDSSGSWRVDLSAGRQPIDFVRIVPYIGVIPPESEAVADAGPPPQARGVNSTVSRDPVMPPPPIAAPTASPAAPRPATPRPAAAAPAPTPSPAPAAAPAAQPAPAPPQ